MNLRESSEYFFFRYVVTKATKREFLLRHYGQVAVFFAFYTSNVFRKKEGLGLSFRAEASKVLGKNPDDVEIVSEKTVPGFEVQTG